MSNNNMKNFRYFEGTVASGKTILLSKMFLKKFRRDCRKYKYYKYVIPFLRFEFWQFYNFSVIVSRNGVFYG